MTVLRRILTGSALAVIAAGLASADTFISYSFTIGPTPTDLTNVQALITPWCPGCTALTGSTAGSGGDFVASNAEPAGYPGAPSVLTGVTMASLNAPSTTYNLVGYDILVQTSISGNFSVTNSANASSNATGTAGEHSYTAIALGANLAPPLTNTQLPTNDLFYTGQNPGWGPNPTTNNLVFGGTGLAPGQTASLSFSNVKAAADLGCDFGPTPDAPPACNAFDEIIPASYLNAGSPMVNVVSAAALDFFLSTATTISTGITGGNNSEVQNTAVTETITVTYDYTTSSGVPEPTTMALMGGALLGLGFLGKRFKK